MKNLYGVVFALYLEFDSTFAKADVIFVFATNYTEAKEEAKKLMREKYEK